MSTIPPYVEPEVDEPFVLRFSTKDSHYAYDVKYNCLVKVDESQYEMIPTMFRDEEATSVLQPEQQKAVDRLRLVNKEIGMFGKARYSHCLGPPIGNDLVEAIEEKLYLLTLETTTACNMRCRYCIYSGFYRGSRNHSSEWMTPAVAKAAVDWLFSHSKAVHGKEGLGISIGFYGGEPLLNLRLIKEVVDYAERHRPNTRITYHMTTNGTHLKPDICRYLYDSEFYLTFSLDGPQPLHDKNRLTVGGLPTYDVVMESLSNWKAVCKEEYSTRTLINCILDPDSDLRAIKQYFDGHGDHGDLLGQIRLGSIALPNTLDLEDGNKFSPTARFHESYFGLWDEFVSEIIRAEPPKDIMFFDGCNSILGDRLDAIMRMPTPKHRRICTLHGMCVPGGERLFVNCRGDFFPCEKVPFWYKIGNINDGIDTTQCERIVKKYTEFRSVLDCRKCWAVNLCMLCLGMIATNSQGNFDVERQQGYCDYCRYEIARALNNFAGIIEKNPSALRSMEERVWYSSIVTGDE